MKDLLIEYKKSRKGLHQMLDNLGNSERDKNDRTTINSMINSITHIIDWMETGRNPYYKRGIDVRYAYDVTRLSNMDVIPDIASQLEQEREPLELTDKQKDVLVKVFMNLSNRERDCFILHHGSLMSMQEVADELGIAKTTVQNYIENGRKKIAEILEGYD